MATFNIATADSVTRKAFSVALFATCVRTPNEMKNLTGEAPQQKLAEAKMKGQTDPGMPIVRVTDLASSAGDRVSIDLFNIIGGKPIMGDRNASGRGEKMTFNSMEIIIDQYTKVVDTGGKMTKQRTVHNLRSLAMATLAGYMPRLESQQCMVHMAGARGSQNGVDWVVPLSTDADFAEIMVNTVKAPTYNRHYVINSTGLTQGGLQLGSIASTDIWQFGHLDLLRTLLDDMEFPMQPVKIGDDPAADDEPMWVLMVSPRCYAQFLAQSSGLRTFQQNAWNRKSYGSKHPLFNGEVGMWNGILVKKMARTIRFANSESTQIITAANEATATESAQAINASLTAGYSVERSLLLGAQALANVYGRNQGSDFHFEYMEDTYDFDRKLEIAAAAMSGKAKVRFNIPNSTGTFTPTDHGVLVVDAAAKQ